MANANPTRLGQANGTGAVDATFLKIFSGEVMTAFEIATLFMNHQMVRSISSGKSATFPIVGRANAAYHTPGTELVGSLGNQNERVITLDGFLVSDNFIPEIDELMNHYDVRRIWTAEAGKALAYQYDSHVAATMILAARTASNLTGEPGGTALAVDGVRTNADTLYTQIYKAAQTLDESNVDMADRACFMKPAQYYLMAQATKYVDKDWAPGNGSIASGKLGEIAGIPLVKTNQLPQSNITTGPAAYQGDFTKTTAIVANKAAVGTLKLQDINTRVSYDERRLGNLVVSKMAVGHGVLRPACAVEIAYNSTP